ncbi:MAG: L-histidine N(alpha)-methyltransferase [bacterium]
MSDGIRWLAAESDRPRLVLFLGSNIGNFDRPHAGEFLHRLADALRPGDHVLAGFDLKKEIEVIRLAYNDGEGAARRFNLNLLERLNRDLGADFDRARFSHYAMYEPVKGAIEFYLVSRVAQRVRVEALRRSFDFGAWEALRVGASQKFLPGEVDAMAGGGVRGGGGVLR